MDRLIEILLLVSYGVSQCLKRLETPQCERIWGIEGNLGRCLQLFLKRISIEKVPKRGSLILYKKSFVKTEDTKTPLSFTFSISICGVTQQDSTAA